MTQALHWTALSIAPTADTKIIRKRYAQLLKAIDQKANPDQFQQLRHAYEAALDEARWLAHDEAQGQATSDQTQTEHSPVETASRHEAASPVTADPSHAPASPVIATPTETHLGEWADTIASLLQRDDVTTAVDILSQHLKSTIRERRNTWSLYQNLIINVCLQGENIPYSFVEAAAELFGWFDPDKQGDFFNAPQLRGIRASILHQDANNVASRFKIENSAEALKFLQFMLDRERLQGLNERDYFEACLLLQSTQQELPLPAMQSINTALKWDKENGHLWALAPQACEDFRVRMNGLLEQQATQDFEAYLHRVAANKAEVTGVELAQQKLFVYLALPFLLSVISAGVPAVLGAELVVVLISFLAGLTGSGLLSAVIYEKRRVQNYSGIEIQAAQNLLSPYRPRWLRWRAFSSARQQRTKEMLAYIESRHPQIREKLDAETVEFWRKTWPSIARDKIAVRCVFALPMAMMIAIPMASADWLSRIWAPALPALIILAMSVLVAGQVYLFSALPIWCDPLFKRANLFLAKWILPKRFQALPSRGLSCIGWIIFSVGASVIISLFSLVFELGAHDSIWISLFIVLPLSWICVGWIYLWYYDRNLDRPTKVTVQNTIRGWHWLLIIFLSISLIRAKDPCGFLTGAKFAKLNLATCRA